MTRRANSLYTQALIGLPALIGATSCVPAERSVAIAQARPDAPTLLRGLALEVPADIARRPRASRYAAAIQTAPPFVATARSAADGARAADCLTAAIYYEARSESSDGQRAVAQVVLNRVRDRAYPGSVCGVVYQGSNRRTGCQFSFTCDGSMDRPRDPGAWDRARRVADAALNGSVYAPVGAATSYHANTILPWWAPSLSRVASVGAHIFYRWQRGLENALSFRQTYAGIESGVAERSASPDVAVHYAGREPQPSAVTIHRGPSVRPAAAMRLVSGVRVHVGARHAPAFEATDDGAIVSAESEAI